MMKRFIAIVLCALLPVSASGLYKNQPNQDVCVKAWDHTNGIWKTGDAANITLYYTQDGGTGGTTLGSPTEVDAANMPGLYCVSVTAAQTDADLVAVHGNSSAGTDIIILGQDYYTVPGDGTQLQAFSTNERGTDNAAPASTALSDAQWTDSRAANLDNLDAAMTSRAPASTALNTSNWTNARAGYLDNIATHVPQTGNSFAIIDDLTENVTGLRYTAKALEQAPTGGGGGPVDLNPDQQGVTIGFVNTVNNPTTCGTVQDKSDYNLAPSQAGVTIGTCGTLASLQPSALANMFTTDSGQTYATAVPGSVVKEIADNAQTASVTVAEIVEAMGGIRTTVASVTDSTNFTLTAGSNVSLAYADEYTAVIGNQADSDNTTCHRKILGYLGPSRTVTIDSACPAGFTVAVGDPVTILPNGAGGPIADVNVNNGQVETDLTVNVDGALSLGCMISAINAVQTGAQTVVNGVDYTYRNPGDSEDRVVATRTASGRSQATITCPAGL